MTLSEALTVKKDDVLEAIFETARYKKGDQFIVKKLHRDFSGMMHDSGADLISLVDGRELLTNLQDFHFADVTKSFRTAEIWKDYIKQKYIPEENKFLDYMNSIKRKRDESLSTFERDFYANEIEAAKILMDIRNGHRDQYGIEICVTQ